MLDHLFQAIGDAALPTLIRENGIIFPWLEAVHVMAISIVVGTIALVDLRLLGLASTTYPVPRLTRAVLPLTWIAFAFALLTGGLMFSAKPADYFANFAFRTKMLMLLGAGLNMATFHLLTMRGPKGDELPVPAAGKAAAVISLILWIVIVALGRWIGFTMTPF